MLCTIASPLLSKVEGGPAGGDVLWNASSARVSTYAFAKGGGSQKEEKYASGEIVCLFSRKLNRHRSGTDT